MKSFSFLCRLALCFVFCLALCFPSFAAQAAAAAPTMEELQKKLDEFAVKNAKSMNGCILPSKNKKEVKKNSDGSWTARYLEVDLDSISTTVKKTDNSSIMKYSGSLRYQEVEWTCTASTKKAAESGPFVVKRRETVTEPVIKYLKGRWTN